mmetsp:Transcript_13545/g.19878  ORF Transcript_13545/g.19878 Transcript_13545/m.19878 type:complete len:128 (-) Transcript_13545:511-894(-)
MDTTGPHTFSLILRLGASTHTTNNDNRRVPIQVAFQNGATSTLNVPQNENILIPGSYYFFAMNSDGVPTPVAVDVNVEGADQGSGPGIQNGAPVTTQEVRSELHSGLCMDLSGSPSQVDQMIQWACN